MYMEHANVVFHLDLTCLREYEIRTLHDIHLLSAPRILPLPNMKFEHYMIFTDY